jgi:hypothetical protein
LDKVLLAQKPCRGHGVITTAFPPAPSIFALAEALKWWA